MQINASKHGTGHRRSRKQKHPPGHRAEVISTESYPLLGATDECTLKKSKPAKHHLWSRMAHLLSAARLLVHEHFFGTTANENQTDETDSEASDEPIFKPLNPKEFEANPPVLLYLAQNYVREARRISKKNCLRWNRSVKRRFCKSCNVPWIGEMTCRVRTGRLLQRNQGDSGLDRKRKRQKGRAVVRWTCLLCGHVKRYPIETPKISSRDPEMAEENISGPSQNPE